MEGRTGEADKQAASSIFVRCSPFGELIGGFPHILANYVIKRG